MKHKLFGTLFLLLVLTASTLQAQNTSNCADDVDTNDIALIKGVFQKPEGVVSGVEEKYLPRMGDRASITLIRILKTNDLGDPQKTTRILGAIHDAFRFPKFITTQAAQQPKVTLLLLDYMSEKLRDPKQIEAINNTRNFVQEKAASLTATDVAIGDMAGSKCTDDNDKNDLALVNSLLHAQEGTVANKNLPGDRVPIALMRTLNSGDLRDPQRTTKIAGLIHDAFSAPQAIDTKAAKQPNAAFFLLEYMSEKLNDPQQADIIRNSRNFVQQMSSTIQSSN